MVETPRSRTCGRPPTWADEYDVDRHCDPRGSPCALRLGFSDRDQGPDAFLIEVLSVVEINADERIVALVAFDLDDIDAAFAELDARYLAGEAAAHAHIWSVIAQAYAAINRHELSATTPDWVKHRPPAAAQRSSQVTLTAIHPCHLGPHAGRSASTSRPCIG